MTTYRTPPTPHALGRVLLALLLAFCPVFGPAVAAPAALPIGAPAEEHEEKTGEAKTAVQWVAPVKGGRRPFAPAGSVPAVTPLPSHHVSSGPVLARAAFVDPFRNGLGSPPRC